MKREELIDLFENARWYDLTQALSIFTPPWPGEMPLQVHFFKRLTGSYGGGQGANGQFIEWSNNTGCHLVGQRAFHSGSRAIADVPLTDICGEGVVADAGHDLPQGAEVAEVEAGLDYLQRNTSRTCNPKGISTTASTWTPSATTG